MDISRMRSLQTLLGRLGGVFALCASLAVLDGVVARHHAPVNVVELLAGESAPVGGPMDPGVKDPASLGVEGNLETLNLSISEIRKGFWLGGNMWRGRVETTPLALPGQYDLTIRVKEDLTQRPVYVLRIVVYPDARGLNAASSSMLCRTLGISPWWVSLAFLVPTAIVFLLVYLLSTKIESIMSEAGLAEIFRVSRNQEVFEVVFGLGAGHGMKAGARLELQDPAGVPCGTVEVIEVSPAHSIGRAHSSKPVRPGFRVVAGRI